MKAGGFFFRSVCMHFMSCSSLVDKRVQRLRPYIYFSRLARPVFHDYNVILLVTRVQTCAHTYTIITAQTVYILYTCR